MNSISSDKRRTEDDNSFDRLFIAESRVTIINALPMLRRLAENIRHRRLALGLTQQRLAERAGMSVKYLGKLEAGRKNGAICPSVMIFSALCQALETTPNELLEQSPPPAGSKRQRAVPKMLHRELGEHALALDERNVAIIFELVRRLVELQPRSFPKRKGNRA
jgi:transcriptional regulator with XRE-family HTH domain